ncbi:MAG: penicillin acylase family protein [Ignavibacteria bacterium]|nr:penicillin acylase family protein [Ignavibacteria bacterium]
MIKSETEKIKSENQNSKNSTDKKKTSYNEFTENKYIAASDLGKNFLELSKSFKTFIGTEGTHVGSNSWVIAGSRTESGKPILANDPHLALQVPAKWYEVSLYDNQKNTASADFQFREFPELQSDIIRQFPGDLQILCAMIRILCF